MRVYALLLVFLAGLAPGFASAWWHPDWQYRKALSVDTRAEAAALGQASGRVALLVRLHAGNFAFDGMAADGADLRVLLGDDKTLLNHQLEVFDPQLGQALLWVDLPGLPADGEQALWLYYGNPKAPQASNGQLSFDPDYLGVYHFAESGQAPRDSSAYGNHAQNDLERAPGLVGQGLRLRGQPLLLPTSASLSLAAGAPFSLSLWLKPQQVEGEQLLFVRQAGKQRLSLGLEQGIPYLQLGAQRVKASSLALPAEAWSLLALTADGATLKLYRNGEEVASLVASLEAMDGMLAIAGDLPQAEGTPGAGFHGLIDELRLSRSARPAALLRADFLGQQADSRLLAFGADEEASGMGFGALGFLLAAVPFDAWIILAVLLVMLLHSWLVMFSKSRNLTRLERANRIFRERFEQAAGDFQRVCAEDDEQVRDSSLRAIFLCARDELQRRREQGQERLGEAALETLWTRMEAVRLREVERLGQRLGGLSNAIAGGPYIGLLGTVLGIMVVFLGAALAGDVSIDAVAPGMAAALLATAMGLFVAIPALFGYNRLVARNKSANLDMRLFSDELAARLAEACAERRA